MFYSEEFVLMCRQIATERKLLKNEHGIDPPSLFQDIIRFVSQVVCLPEQKNAENAKNAAFVLKNALRWPRNLATRIGEILFSYRVFRILG